MRDIHERLLSFFKGGREWKPSSNLRQSLLNSIEKCRQEYEETRELLPVAKALALVRWIGESPPQWALNSPEIMKFRERARLEIIDYERVFHVNRNPMIAFHAYFLSRCFHLPVPEWIHLCFDEGLLSFQKSYELFANGEKGSDPAREFAKAFGIRLQTWKEWQTLQGVMTPSVEAREKGVTDPHWLTLGVAVLAKLVTFIQEQEDAKETSATAAVAEERGLSGSTVWRAWARFKAAYPELVPLLRERTDVSENEDIS